MGELYLIRHAQASFGAEDYDKLSVLGHEQSVALGNALSQHGVMPEAWVTGTCAVTAKRWKVLQQGWGSQTLPLLFTTG